MVVVVAPEATKPVGAGQAGVPVVIKPSKAEKVEVSDPSAAQMALTFHW